MGFNLSPRIGERFCELMVLARENRETLATKVHEEAGINPNSANKRNRKQIMTITDVIDHLFMLIL